MQKNKLNLRICGIHLLNPYKTVVSHLNLFENVPVFIAYLSFNEDALRLFNFGEP